jgi:hypothetical protein
MKNKNQIYYKNIDYLDNYYDKIISDDDKINLSNIINKNLHNMDINEKLNILKKIKTEHYINKELLKFEFENYIPKICQKRKDIIKEMNYILKRYQYIAGGYKLEDEWTFYNFENNKYELYKNEIIFENSISQYYKENDEEHLIFINKIVEKFRKISDKTKVNFKYIKDKIEKDVYWIIIKVDFI